MHKRIGGVGLPYFSALLCKRRAGAVGVVAQRCSHNNTSSEALPFSNAGYSRHKEWNGALEELNRTCLFSNRLAFVHSQQSLMMTEQIFFSSYIQLFDDSLQQWHICSETIHNQKKIFFTCDGGTKYEG